MQNLELLGTTLDSGLNFSDQIATNSKDTSRMIRVLMRPQKINTNQGKTSGLQVSSSSLTVQ